MGEGTGCILLGRYKLTEKGKMGNSIIDIRNAQTCLTNALTNIHCVFDDEYDNVTAENSIQDIGSNIEQSLKHLSKAKRRLELFIEKI